ncbi:MAG: metal ABC transporter solute-binding protein, Zn/Mn family [Victivallaceae bacterium]
MFRVIQLSLAAALFALCGCGQDNTSRPDIVAGLPPVAFLAEKIAGPDLKVVSALPVGRSPHDFSPRPGEIRDIAGAKVYFHTGMPFENAIAKALDHGRIRPVDVGKDIVRIPMDEDCCEEHGHNHGEHKDADRKDAAQNHDHDEELDPHLWLSPKNCILMATTIERELSQLYPEKAAQFKANLAKVVAELEATDAYCRKQLSPYKGQSFLVYHPAFGYFAHEYGLEQHGIELSGREPSPAQLAEVIKEAHEHKVKTIFVQMQFNPNAANALAKAIGGDTVELDPLAPDMITSFRTITDHIVKGFKP